MTRSRIDRLKGLGNFIRRAMAEWRVPGLAIAVVDHGRTILAEGFGRRDVGRNLPMTPQTTMPIASVTKAFTAAAMGILVDEKRVEWDKPVRDYLPAFRLHDPVATERLTVRDLLCHRCGLPRHDYAWYRASLSRQEMFRRLRYLPPSCDLRSAWQYQNLMYMVAGLVIQEVTGKTWEDFIRQRLLGPLGMRRSSVTIDELKQSDDYALPYVARGRSVAVVPFYEQWAIAPAGAVNACVTDLANWMAMNLAGGAFGRTRIVSEKTLREIQSPAAVVPFEQLWPEVLQPTYALGWSVQPYRGRTMVAHGGSIDGFATQLTLLPSEKLGLVVLTNLHEQPAQNAVTFAAVDLLLGEKPAPWLERFRNESRRQKRLAAVKRRKAAGGTVRRGAKPARPAADYLGEYRHQGYGACRVERAGGRRLRVLWNGSRCPLRHLRADVFRFDFPRRGDQQIVSFYADAEGRIDRLTVPFDPVGKPILFIRCPPGK